MEIAHSQHKSHIGNGTYILIWLTLVSLTILTVTIAAYDLGKYTLLVALLIAALKSGLVINIFMHIKFEDKLFKVFIALALSTLLAVFIFTSFDIFFR